MENGALMRMVDGACDPHEQARSLAERERSRADGESLSERATFHKLHAVGRTPVLFAHLVNGNDIRMIEPGSGPSLGAESLHLPFARELARQDHLERDPAVQLRISRTIDHTHPSVPYLLQEFVAAETAQVQRRLPVCFSPRRSPAPSSNAESDRPASNRHRAQTLPEAKRPKGEPHLRQASFEFSDAIIVSRCSCIKGKRAAGYKLCEEARRSLSRNLARTRTRNPSFRFPDRMRIKIRIKSRIKSKSKSKIKSKSMIKNMIKIKSMIVAEHHWLTTRIRCRISSSISPGWETVRAISSRSNSR